MNTDHKLDQALALAAIGLALLGQYLFYEDQTSYSTGLFYFGAAVLIFLILVRRREPAEEPEELGFPAAPDQPWNARLRHWLTTRPIAAVLIGLGVAVAGVVAQLMKDPLGLTNYNHVFLLWLLSMALILAAAVDQVPRRPNVRDWLTRHRFEVLIVVGLTALAGILRFAALGAVPDIVSGDEGTIGWIALTVRDGAIKNMFATKFGHSVLYLYGIAMGMNVFGTGPLGLRFTSALMGTLNVPVLYALARRMFNPRVAVVAAGLLAVSHIHVHFSRIIVAGSIQDAFWATVIFYLFYTALQTRSTVQFVISALALGIHFHIYMGGRLLILLMPVLIVALFALAKGGRALIRANLGNLVFFSIALVVSAMPLLVWGLNHWPDFMARGNLAGIVQSGWLAQEVHRTGEPQAWIFGRLVLDALLTVNHFPAYWFYYAKLPMLDFVGGALFMLGLGYALYRLRDVRFLILHGWFWSAVVVGGALVIQTKYSAYRILIILPVVCVFVGVAVDRLLALAVDSRPTSMDGVDGRPTLVDGVGDRPTSVDVVGDHPTSIEGADDQPASINGLSSRPTSTVFLAAVLFAMGVLNVKGYFVDYAPTCAYENWRTRFASFMGGYLKEAGPDYQAYLFGAPDVYYSAYKSIDYLKGNNEPVTDIVQPIHAAPEFAKPDEKSIFFFTPDRQDEIQFIEDALPGGQEVVKQDCGELLMVVYRYDGT